MVTKAKAKSKTTVKAVAPKQETPTKEVAKPVSLQATKNSITNLVTGEAYKVNKSTTPSNGIGHWEKRQIEAGLLIEV